MSEREEPVLEPDLPIIDSHHHLFDRPNARYMFEDYLADAGAGHRIIASVYVETLAMSRPGGPEPLRPLGEVEFANGVAAMSASGGYGPCRVAAGIVGYADLRLGGDVGLLLDRALAAAPDRFRGVRQTMLEHPSDEPFRFVTHRPPEGVLDAPGFRAGFRELAARGLSFDAAVFHHQLPRIAELADAFPDTTIVLNHLGLAMGLGLDPDGRREVMADWRKALLALAQRPNVVCKVGGLGLPFWGFGFETRKEPVGYQDLAQSWRPYVETAVEAFGAHRCMTESNYPPDARSCGFVALWNALKLILGSASAAEKAALYRDTAQRVYRLDAADC
jgi:L-fuconolactonase